jgi:hypothetical protein
VKPCGGVGRELGLRDPKVLMIPHNGEHSDQGEPIAMRCREAYVST